jgi:co-chaperonin GroES (HSP10)
MPYTIKSIKPIRDRIIVSDMDFGDQRTATGLIILSDDGKSFGVKPRWGRVYAVGAEQKDVSVGNWVLIEHGRWSRGVELENDDGSTITLRQADKDAILLISDEKPGDAYIAAEKLLNLSTD